MKNLSDFINESRGKNIKESAGNIPPEVFDGAKGVIKDAKFTIIDMDDIEDNTFKKGAKIV